MAVYSSSLKAIKDTLAKKGSFGLNSSTRNATSEITKGVNYTNTSNDAIYINIYQAWSGQGYSSCKAYVNDVLIAMTEGLTSYSGSVVGFIVQPGQQWKYTCRTSALVYITE